MMPANTFNDRMFTTSYSYGSDDKEYLFSCKGRPFVALVSPNLPTPSSSLIDYDLIRKMGLTMTDLQCRKLYFGGHKMRILGRVSTAVQCIKDGRINGNFHVKGLVIADLYQMMETHCVAGARMQERLAHLAAYTEADSDEESDEEMLNTSLDGEVPQSSPSTAVAMKFSSSTASAMKSSPSTASAMKSSPSTASAMKSPPSTAVTMKSTPTGASRKPPVSSPNRALSPDTIESRRLRQMRLEKRQEETNESMKLWKNRRAWGQLTTEDPEYAWWILKDLADANDWPDWDSNHSDLEELSLDDDPHVFRDKWLCNLEMTKPDCLCLCGSPHLNHRCNKTRHEKKSKHCENCCDDPKKRRNCLVYTL